MRRFTKYFAGPFARLMAASWLLQVVFPALCCCCCLGGGTAMACGSNEALYNPRPCCCQAHFGRLHVASQGAAPHSVVECRGATCPTCESCGSHGVSDSRPSTVRRRQLEGSERPIAALVLPFPSDLSECDSQRSVSSWTDACNKGAALSAPERCVNLQRFLL
jgi:hypothetical protein